MVYLARIPSRILVALSKISFVPLQHLFCPEVLGLNKCNSFVLFAQLSLAIVQDERYQRLLSACCEEAIGETHEKKQICQARSCRPCQGDNSYSSYRI